MTTQTPLEMILSLETQLSETSQQLKVLQKEGNHIPGKAWNGRSISTLSESEVLNLAGDVSRVAKTEIDWLEVNVKNDSMYMGYPVVDWKKDINRRLKIIKFSAHEKALMDLIAELEPILPEEVKTARKMAKIQEKMAQLTPVLKG